MEFTIQLYLNEETSRANVTVNARIRVIETDTGYIAINAVPFAPRDEAEGNTPIDAVTAFLNKQLHQVKTLERLK